MLDLVLFDGLKGEELITKLKDLTFKAYDNKIAPVRKQVLPDEKVIALRLMDRAWVNHIDIMAKLR